MHFVKSSTLILSLLLSNENGLSPGIGLRPETDISPLEPVYDGSL